MLPNYDGRRRHKDTMVAITGKLNMLVGIAKYLIMRPGELRLGVMDNKHVALNQLQLSSEFDLH